MLLKVVGELAHDLEKEINQFEYELTLEQNKDIPSMEKNIILNDSILIQKDSKLFLIKEKDLPEFTETIPQYKK